MRFKVDENIHGEAAVWLRHQGHDALSVREQNHSGSPDARLAAVCRHENRILITQDLDFANIVAYPPEHYPGIVVLRLNDQSWKSAKLALSKLLPVLQLNPAEGQLWIVDESSMRVRRGDAAS